MIDHLCEPNTKVCLRPIAARELSEKQFHIPRHGGSVTAGLVSDKEVVREPRPESADGNLTSEQGTEFLSQCENEIVHGPAC